MFADALQYVQGCCAMAIKILTPKLSMLGAEIDMMQRENSYYNNQVLEAGTLRTLFSWSENNSSVSDLIERLK